MIQRREREHSEEGCHDVHWSAGGQLDIDGFVGRVGMLAGWPTIGMASLEARRMESPVAVSRPLVAFHLICNTDLQYCDDATRIAGSCCRACRICQCMQQRDHQAGWSREVGGRSRLPRDGFQAKRRQLPVGRGREGRVEFDCKFTGPEGKEYTAHMKVTRVEGDDVEFYVESKPS